MNPASSTARPPATARTARTSQWAGHDLNYLAVGGYLDCCGPRADGGPALPGATIADSAGGGMHAVMAILAALVRRAATGEGAYLDVSVADGVLSLMSLYIDEYLATGDRARARPRHPHRPLRLLRRLPLRRRQVGGGRRHRAAVLRQPVPRSSAASSGSSTRPTTPRRTRSAPTSAPRSRPATATSGSRRSGRPTPASRRSRRSPELVDDPHFAARARLRRRRRTPTHGAVPPARPAARRHGPRARTRRVVRDADRHRHRRAAARRRLHR